MLSDELIELGKKSNPKSNLSQNEAAGKMLDLLHEHAHEYSPKNLWYIISYACKQLNKAGWSFFKPDGFMSKVSNSNNKGYEKSK